MSPSTLEQSISNARSAGATDDEIVESLTGHPEHGQKIKDARAAGAGSKDILAAISSVPPAPTSFGEKLSEAYKKLASNDPFIAIASGAAHTGLGAYGILKKGAKFAGLGDLPEAPESVKRFASGEDLGTVGKAIRGGEQLAEFALPGGVVTKGVKAVSKLGKIAQVGARALGEAASAGGVAGVQSGGDIETAAHSALWAGAASGLFSTIGSALKAIPAYKPTFNFPDRVSLPQRKEIIQQGIENNVLISEPGLKRAQGLVEAGAKEKAGLVGTHATQLLDTSPILKQLENMKNLRTTISPQGDPELIAGVQKIIDKHFPPPPPVTVGGQTFPVGIFVKKFPQLAQKLGITDIAAAGPPKITVAEANEINQNLNNLIDKYYGHLVSIPGEAEKVVNHGLKIGLETLIPELAQVNRSLQNSIYLRNAIEDYLKSPRGQEVIKHPSIIAASLMASLGFKTGFHFAVPSALLYEALSNPRIRSALAVLQHAAGDALTTGGFPATAARVAGYASSRYTQPTLKTPIPEVPK